MPVFKGSTLLEADPSSNYERAVRDFAKEMTAAGRGLFVLTSKGSPVYLLLREIAGLRFFLFSDVSYPKASAGSLEVMVPRSDLPVLLNVVDDAVSKAPKTPKAIIFDNISSMMLDSGLQDTYKFLRQVNEIVSHGDVVLLAIILSKAHDERTMSAVLNLYSQQLAYDSEGLHTKKQT